MTESKFAELGLCSRLVRALDEEKYEHPTPVQFRAIPHLLAGSDLLGIAQTGTGKTAAYTLPLIENLIKQGGKADPGSPRALVLVPTRELAIQVSESIKTYGRHVRIRHTVVMGGVSQRNQVDALRRGVDVLIATTGRLVDLINQGHVHLNQCEHVILDEADRMLDMGFIRDVRKIAAMLPHERQTIMFSATMPKEVGKLAAEILNDPQRVEIAAKTVAVDRIEQSVYHLDAGKKRDLLAKLLEPTELSRVIVFTRTKRGADNVAKRLSKEGINTGVLHGNKSQNARQRALDSFKAGKVRVLVATDIAARGLDVDDVSHVINYELPNEPESYVHRIGRTARAGANGVAISFCDASERSYLRDIQKLIKQELIVIGDVPTGPIQSTGPGKKRGPSRSNRRPGSGPARPRRRRSKRADRRAA